MNIEIFALLKYSWMALGAWFWYDRKKLDDRLDKMSSKLNNTPTKEDVEKEIAKSVTSIKEDQREMIVMTREMSTTLNQLVRDLAVLNAKWSMMNERNVDK